MIADGLIHMIQSRPFQQFHDHVYPDFAFSCAFFIPFLRIPTPKLNLYMFHRGVGMQDSPKACSLCGRYGTDTAPPQPIELTDDFAQSAGLGAKSEALRILASLVATKNG